MSVRRVSLVTLRKGVEPSAIARALDHGAGALRSHAAPHLPGSLGGGDLTWDVLFDSTAKASAETLEEQLAAVRGSVDRVDAVLLEPIASHVADPALAGVKRTLFLCVRPDAAPARVEAFERDVLAMPHYIPAIRNWSLARAGAGSLGGWTHVWEQEFATLDGLVHDYMTSPYHWGLVDGWFDAECPQCIVAPRLAHVYCNARESVLGWR
jgi:stress responsive alpha/beta barrel protein